ncbi:MAG: zinc metallopeptidase [Tissierellia bacterium]|nr:zinc metallopeptidase [Tissierellia bacterium]
MIIDSSYIIFIVPCIILSMIAQFLVKSRYNKYSNIDSGTGLTGADVAKQILQKNGIYDVTIRKTPGVLTDHYDPRTKTVMLSDRVYSGSSVSSLSIAAHEVGHAMQKNEEYLPLSIRAALVPVANIGTNLAWVLIIMGIAIEMTGFVKLGIIMFSFGVLFQVVTLPVEFNASNRAIEALADGIMPPEKIPASKKVLGAAALTYVAAAATAIAQLLRVLYLTRGRRDD